MTVGLLPREDEPGAKGNSRTGNALSSWGEQSQGLVTASVRSPDTGEGMNQGQGHPGTAGMRQDWRQGDDMNLGSTWEAVLENRDRGGEGEWFQGSWSEQLRPVN